ncbi:MAG: hypothetical protein CMM30_04200 [Rhodospirillaceae bacterium]|nr:hypothetical protein [Rhodospirillaceae bacterium]|tara:strand:- start:8526 stop:9179 length:654 start_codon:yes stop_codon:yes gene_type:complete
MQNGLIDIYCERSNFNYWAEPINATTNFAFIISGLFVIYLIRKTGKIAEKDIVLWIFAGLIIIIGIGSWLFHTHATKWAMVADVTPIVLFILLYTWFAIRRFTFAPKWACYTATIATLALSVTLETQTGFAGGAYLAPFLAMLLMGVFLHYLRSHPAGKGLLLACIIFGFSLTLRSIDEILCINFPVGTHFLWHLLNAIVLFIVTKALVVHSTKKES